MSRLQAGSTYVLINAKVGNAADLSGANNRVGPNQQWTLEYAGYDFFRIKNGTGKYLSIDGGARNGAPVIGSDHQQTWKITVDGDGFRIFYPGTDFNLDLKGYGDPKPGNPIYLWNNNNGKHQVWLFQPKSPSTTSVGLQAGSTYVLINAKATGSAADLSGANNREVIGYGIHKGRNQQWTLEYAGYGFFRIKNGTGKYLGVDGAVRNGARVIGSDHQQSWKVTADDRQTDGFRIIYPGTNFNVDLEGHGNSNPGTPIQLWDKTDGKNQVWSFKPF